jgi:hypothetical protein
MVSRKKRVKAAALATRGALADAFIQRLLYFRLAAMSGSFHWGKAVIDIRFLPSLGEGGALGGGGEDALAAFPVDSFDLLILDVEGVFLRDGGDDLLGAFDFAQSYVNPHVLQNIGNLAEQGKDFLQARGQELVDAIFDGVEIPHVVNENGVAQLADALNAAFALLQARWIPGQVQIYEGG